MNLKFQLQHGMKNLDYLMDHILYQIFEIILNISLKTQGEKTDNPSIRIYVNKIEKDKNGKNVPHLKIIKVVLVHCNILTTLSARFKNLVCICS